MVAGPATAITVRARRIAGNAIRASMNRITMTSASGKWPATSPDPPPKSPVTINTENPTTRESRVPCMTRASRSRPKSSVPNQWPTDGAARMWLTSMAVGSAPMTKGSSSTRSTMPAMMTPPAMARRCRLSRCHSAQAGAVRITEASSPGARMWGRLTPSAIVDLRIDECIEHVDDQVDHDDHGRDQQDTPLHERVIAPLHGHDDKVAHAREIEDGLDDKSAAQEYDGHVPDDRQHLHQGVAQGVTVDHRPFGQPLGPRGADVFHAQDLQHAAPGNPGQQRRLDEPD